MLNTNHTHTCTYTYIHTNARTYTDALLTRRYTACILSYKSAGGNPSVSRCVIVSAQNTQINKENRKVEKLLLHSVIPVVGQAEPGGL